MPARSQLTLRIDETLARRLKRVAGERGQSVNAFATQALQEAVDPDLAGSERERHRRLLAEAGILSVTKPVDFEGPSDEEFEELRRRASGGTPLSEYVIRGRREREF